jgi:hypothetical protein
LEAGLVQVVPASETDPVFNAWLLSTYNSHTHTFLSLSDTPTGFTGASGFAVKVNASGTALEFGEAGGGTFISLSDTPTGYTGASAFNVKVNAAGTALEFASGVNSFSDLSGVPTGFTGASGFPVTVSSNATGLIYNDEAITHLPISTITGTTYTLVLTDDGKYLRCNNASGCVVTVPLYSSVAFDTGVVISFNQIGAGTVSVTGATTGVTLNAYDGLSTYGQYAGMQIVNVSQNIWDVIAGQ